MRVETIEDYIAFWVHEKRSSERTVEEYKRDLKAFVIYCSKVSIVPTEITPKEIRKYVQELSIKKLAPASIARVISSLRTFFKWAIMEGIVEKDPAYYLVIPRKDKKLPVYLNALECKKIIITNIDTTTSTELQRSVIVFLMMICGLRAGEVRGLKINMIERKETGAPARIKVFGKGRKERLIPCPEPLNRVLWDWMLHRKRLKMWDYAKDYRRPAAYVNSDYLIPGIEGDKLSYHAINYATKKACELADVKVLSPHKLRHTFATNLHRNGTPITVIKKALGHESINTTQIYTHVEQEELEKYMIKENN